MRRHHVLLALALLAAADAGGPAAAQFYPGGKLDWGPNGNGTLDHEDDLRWVMFHVFFFYD